MRHWLRKDGLIKLLSTTRVLASRLPRRENAPMPRPNKRRRIDKSSSDIPASLADQEPRQDDVTDLEWMKQRMSKNVDVVEKAFEQSEDEGEPDALPVEKDDTKETILQTSRLFVRNLSFLCTDEELADILNPLAKYLRFTHLWIRRPNSGKVLHM